MDKLPFTTLKILFTPYPWALNTCLNQDIAKQKRHSIQLFAKSQFRSLFLPINRFYSELSSYLWLCEQLMSMLNQCCFSACNFKCCSYFVRLNKKVLCIFHWLKLAICFSLTFCNNKFEFFEISLKEPLYI